MKTFFLIFTLLCASLFGFQTLAQTQQEKAAGAYEAAKEQVEQSQRAGIEQGKRDAILGRSSKHDFDNVGTLFLVILGVFVTWTVFKWFKDKSELDEAARDAKLAHEEQLREKKEAREEADKAREIENKKSAIKLHEVLTAFEEKMAVGEKGVHIRFIGKSDDDIKVYAACFNKEGKILSDYGIFGEYTNSTTDEDDSKYESILDANVVLNPAIGREFKTMEIMQNEFSDDVSYISIYASTNLDFETFHQEMSIEVMPDGMQSEATPYSYKIESQGYEVFLNVGCLRKSDNKKWEFLQISNIEVDMDFDKFTEGKKRDIMSTFQKSFKSALATIR
jgi:hypothetical protein